MVNNNNDATKIVNDFKLNDKDTGSAQVQVINLTSKINELSEHFKANPKDKSSIRGLKKLVEERRKFLKYLKNKNVEIYKNIINRLGLRK